MPTSAREVARTVKSLEASSLNLDNSGNSVHATENTRTTMTKNLKAWLLKWLIDIRMAAANRL